MAFERMTQNVLNVSALPNAVTGQASSLKATFDAAGVSLKTFINALLDVLEANGAESIGADVSSVTTKTVQAILTAFEAEIANRYTKTEIDTLVAEDTNDLVADLDVNLTTGVITVTKKDGTVETFDTALEKVPATFEIVESNGSYALKITNVDGTTTQADITSFMNLYTFANSDYITFEVTGTGNEKTVTANIKANSIGLDKLSLSVVSTLEGYMTSARDSANAAKISENNAKSSANTATKAAEKASIAEGLANTAINKATEAESYAHGGTGTREGEDTDNAKYYSQVAKEVAGGDFVTPTEMEAYAQKKGTVPSFEGEELSGEVIEADVPLEMESILHISGNSEQDSRSGKNIQPPSYRTGIYNADTGAYIANTNYLANQNKIPVIPNTQYVFSSDLGYTFEAYLYDENEAYLKRAYAVSNVFTTSENTYYINWRTMEMGENDLNSKVQLEEGSEATPYEPYGVQPSPDYPSEIRSVKSKSDNLFDKDNIVNMVSSALGHIISENGSRGYYIECKPNTTYSAKRVTPTTDRFSIAFTSELPAVDVSIVNGYPSPINKNQLNKDVVISATSAEDSKYLFLTFSNSGEETPDIMLVEGEYTKETMPSYQPYGYVPVEAKVERRNLLNTRSPMMPQYPPAGLRATLIKNGFNLKASNISTSASYYSAIGFRIGLAKDYIGEKFTFCAKIKSNISASQGSWNMRIKYGTNQYEDMQTNIKQESWLGISQEERLIFVSTNIPETATGNLYLWVVQYTTTGSSVPNIDVDITEIQMLRGEYEKEHLPPYAPYVEPKTISLPLGDIQLRSTPDGTRDTFARVDGVWNKVSNIGSTILTSFNAEATVTSLLDKYISFYKNFAHKVMNTDKIGTMCNNFLSVSRNEATTIDKENCGLNDTGTAIFITILRSRLSTVNIAGFNEWLGNHQTEFIYPLATPTYTPITDSALIQALDELEQLILHKGYNRITVTSVNGVKAYLDLSIPPTASVTNVVETEATSEMIVPLVSGEGDVKVKIPTENKMTLNLATGEVKVGDAELATKGYVDGAIATGTPEINLDDYYTKTEVDDELATKQNKVTYSTTDLTAGTSELATGEIYLVFE